MRKILKIIGFILAFVIIYSLMAILFFDKKCHNEQSIVINAPVEKVWSHVNSMEGFLTWNPWVKYDPNLKISYSGNRGEKGDRFYWKGNDDVGEGEQEITTIIPMEKVSSKIHFIKPMDDIAFSDVILVAKENGIKVTWTLDYEVDNIWKPMKPLMDYQMNKSYKEGLETLKQLAEK